MKLEVQHYFHNHGEAVVINKLDTILQLLRESKKREVSIMADLTALQAKVAQNTSVIGSAVVLIDGLAAQIEALKTDPVALQALADQLEADSQILAAKVLQNTPQAPSA